jgi:Arylsulfatase A and related enzymes
VFRENSRLLKATHDLTANGATAVIDQLKWIAWTAVLLFPLTSMAQERAGQRPNIVVILTDDMGYSDLGCYGGTDARTPNLDALAERGLRFTQFYNTARCCPTRASLLTGLYPHQAGVGHMMNDRGVDGYRGNLNRHCVTVAEVLRTAGYRTYMTGKWHVTKDTGPESDRANWPLQRGFEKYYGTLHGAGNYFYPRGLCRQNDLITIDSDPEYPAENYYFTDAVSDHAVRYIREHQQESPEKPFFMYVAYTAAHWPMQAPEEEISKYSGLFNDGYDAHRKARLAKMKSLGLVSPETELSPGAEDWDAVKQKDWEARCMEVYCAMVDRMDAGVGRIVKQLEQSGQLDNTLILFLQDNGACAEGLGRSAGQAPRGYAVPGKTLRYGPGEMPGPGDTYIAYGRGWANVSNTPFREYKHWVHEGGISTPLIAHWPAHIPKTLNGTLVADPGHLIDIMATCVDLAGATYPETYQGEAIKPMEGVSLKPAFSGKPIERKEPLYWEHEGNKAIRDGKWKLVAKSNGPWELYDISQDRIESNDLSAQYPDQVKRLSELWENYAHRANVYPMPGRGNNNSRPAGSNAKRFGLKGNEELKGQKAPAIVNRSFAISAKVTVPAEKSSGVIVAQGGTRVGYSLYLQEGYPVLTVRTTKGARHLKGSTPLTGTHQVRATLTKSGDLQLQVDNQSIEQGASGGLIDAQPVDGLSVGRDAAGAVGNYTAPFPFSGTVESVVVEFR